MLQLHLARRLQSQPMWTLTFTTYHDWTTGRAVTGTLDFLNGTPIDWFSKRQNTVETATYGSEFVAARIATDRIIDMRMTLWCSYQRQVVHVW